MKYYLLTMLLFLSFGLQAQRWGKPFITNYSAKEFQAESQIWAIMQDTRGIMYFGSNNAVVKYDGTNWGKIRVSNGTVVRSLGLYNGTVYVGAAGEFGYLAPDSVGKMSYRSLMKYVPPLDREFTDVWNTIELDGGVYFHSYLRVMRWKKGRLKIWRTLPQKGSHDGEFQNMSKVNNKIYINKNKEGLFEIINDQLKLIAESEFLGGMNVRNLLSFQDGKILICTRSHGIFVYDPKGKPTFKPFDIQANDFFLKNQIYRATEIRFNHRKHFAITTSRGGLVLLDSLGNWETVFDKESGLQDQNVRFVYFDRQDAIWLGLDNGISRIEINSPIQRWDASNGLDGGVAFALRHEKHLYVSTGLGLYRFDNERFSPVKNIATQTWQQTSYTVPNTNQKLHLVATGDGIYQVNNQEANKIIDRTSTTVLVPSKQNPYRVFIGSNSNLLSSMRYANGKWIDEGEMEGFHHEGVFEMVEKENGDLWIATDHAGLLRVRFENPKANDLKIVENAHYDTLKGLPSMNKVGLYKSEEKLFFSTEKGVYEFDEPKDSFVPSPYFSKQYTNGSVSVVRTIADYQGDHWLVLFDGNAQWMEKFQKQAYGKFAVDSVTLKRLYRTTVESLYTEADGSMWIASSDGLFRYQAQIKKDYSQKFNASILRITSTNDSHDIFGGTFYTENPDEEAFPLVQAAQPSDQLPQLTYSHNSLTFYYGSNSYDNEKSNLYSYYLEGHDSEWSAWSPQNRKEYTNLLEGSYVFKVRAKNIYDQVSEEASYRFTILPPWYRESWMVLIYLVTAVAGIFGIVKFYTRRLEKDKTGLESVINLRTTEILTQKEQIEEKNRFLETQKQEIEVQKDKLQQSFRNIKLLSNIGQDITATRTVEEIIEKTYENINTLMDAAAFGIGVYWQKDQKVEFRGFIENGEKLPAHFEDMNDPTRLSAWCIRNEKDVLINDYQKEILNYLSTYKTSGYGEVPESVIYHPLIFQNKITGVITVQSFRKNAYSQYHMNIMDNLAVYVAISMENALLYENLEEQVQERTAEVVRQSEEIMLKTALLEKQTGDLVSSINYALRIQKAILPTAAEIKEVIKDFFVLLRPRDVISGDFYWFSQNKGKFTLAAVDCTGHSVPGAFMSLVGNDLLSEINSLGITAPDLVLNELHKRIRKSLKQIETQNRDGMDIAICTYDPNLEILQFAGARNVLLYIQNGQMHVVKGDKMSIGGVQREQERIFTLHEISVAQPTACYMFSDGFQDQFGGNEGKKFMFRNLTQLLYNLHHRDMPEQRKELDERLKTWMMNGKYKQIDDVLVMGFRINPEKTS